MRRTRVAEVAWFAFVGLTVFCLGCRVDESERDTGGPDPAFDNFERATIGKNWIVYDGNVDVVGNSDMGIVSKNPKMLGLGVVAWNGTIFSADQFSEAFISSDKDSNALIQVFVRRRTNDGERYGFHWTPRHGGRWEIKRDGRRGAPTLASVTAPNLMPGDTIRIEIAGDVIMGFHNGVKVIEARDSMLTGTGQPGLALNVSMVESFPVPMVEAWKGGSLQPGTASEASYYPRD